MMMGTMSPSARLMRNTVGDGFTRQNRCRVQRSVAGRRGRSIVKSAISYEIDGDVVRVKPTKRKFVTVLSVDGGGVRGLIPAVVLQAVEKAIIKHIQDNEKLPEDAKNKRIQVDMADFFDCISGTSVGSIVALYLATKGAESEKLFKDLNWGYRPGSVEGLVELLSTKAEVIFPDPLFKGIPFLRDFIIYFKSFFVPKFSEKGVETVMKELFGEQTLMDAKTGVVVPTFEITQNRGFSFWSSDGDSGYVAVRPKAEPKLSRQEKIKLYATFQQDGKVEWDPDVEYQNQTDYKLWQVARASSAAPTFFPSASFNSIGGNEKTTFIDGGVIANNPTMQSIVFLEYKRGCKMTDIAMLSLGTGHTQPETSPLERAGAFGWVIKGNLISILMDGSSECLQSLVDLIYYKMLKAEQGQYVRISTCVQQDDADEEVLSSMDNPDNVERLRQIGKELGRQYQDEINVFVEDFLFAEA